MAGNSSDEGVGRREESEDGVKKPLVSVVMPAYNSAATLSAALESALSQQVSVEILLMDDCSTDEIDAVLERFRKYPQIRYERNEKQMGAAKSRNRAVKKARGTYVAFLDSDDYWAPGKLKKQIQNMEQKKCALCCTARELMKPEGELTGKVIGVKEQITYRDLLRHNSINCSSVLLRTEVAREFPMEHEDSHEDYITWLRILKKYGIAIGINEPLLKYRLTNSGKSGSKLKSAVMTFRVYRYMGFNWSRSAVCFISYALHGVCKYLTAGWKKIET